jgi:hypothetical protein
MRQTAGEVMTLASAAGSEQQPGLLLIAESLTVAISRYESVVSYVLDNAKDNVRAVYAGSVPYLMLTGYVLGGWHMARSALACVRARQQCAQPSSRRDEQHESCARQLSETFAQNKIATAVFYCGAILPRVKTLSETIHQGVVLTQVVEHSTLMK